VELISCVIPTWNRAERVADAVRSALEQDWPAKELIIIDDGSTDETAFRLRPFLGPSVRYERQAHTGVSAARNRGIAQAQGEWIALLDSDDQWLPGKLTRQMQFFREQPEFLIGQTEEIWIRNGRRVNPMKKHRKYGGWIFEQCLPLCIVSPSAVMMRRELFEKVGTFDEALPACEDYDLWLRVSARYPIGLVGEPLTIKYGGHADQLSRTAKYLDRYRIRALEKLLGTGELTPEQYRLALAELRRKCKVYGEGCLKRGREDEGRRVLALPGRFEAATPGCSEKS